MAQKNQVLDMSPIGMIFTVINAGEDTEGQSLDLHWRLLPGCNMKDPLIHTHPFATETYEILNGEMEFYVKDKWVKAKKGDKLAIPPGMKHAFRNPGPSEVEVLNSHKPALKMEYFFEDVCRVLDIVTENRTKNFAMNLNAKMHMSALMSNYREDIIAKNPPDAALRVLGVFARLRGISYEKIKSLR